MKTPDECKDEVAEKHGYLQWSNLFGANAAIFNEVIELYVTSQIEDLTKENARLTEIVKGLEEAFKNGSEVYSDDVNDLSKQIETLKSENDRYREALEDCIQRMSRARKLLTERDGQPDCWQMLNAEKYEAALHPLVKEGE